MKNKNNIKNITVLGTVQISNVKSMIGGLTNLNSDRSEKFIILKMKNNNILSCVNCGVGVGGIGVGSGVGRVVGVGMGYRGEGVQSRAFSTSQIPIKINKNTKLPNEVKMAKSLAPLLVNFKFDLASGD
jgi:hypothetical protein